jgi:hypothetical protein
LAAGGEMVLFDRSWCNRTGVERAMGFCSDAEYEEFLQSVFEFERMLARAGITLIKYWFTITDEQAMRFQLRIHDPLKQWKLSPMDLESRRRWEAYTKGGEATVVNRPRPPLHAWPRRPGPRARPAGRTGRCRKASRLSKRTRARAARPIATPAAPPGPA